jgi:hypothetical protein
VTLGDDPTATAVTKFSFAPSLMMKLALLGTVTLKWRSVKRSNLV